MVKSDAPAEEFDYWCGVLRAVGGKMIDTCPGDRRWTAVVVCPYRDGASWKVQSEGDEETLRFRPPCPMPYDPDERVDVVPGESARDDLMPLVLGLAAIERFDEMMSWKSQDLGARVLLLVERDASARIRFEVRLRNEYFDLLPVLREYRRYGAGEETR